MNRLADVIVQTARFRRHHPKYHRIVISIEARRSTDTELSADKTSRHLGK